MKKCLMMVASKAQLLAAFHIRNKMLINCKVDIVLLTDTFDEGYAKRLSDFFDNVWLVKNNYFTQKDFLKFLLNPKKALYSKIGSIFDFDYSDIFNWDPGWCFYYLVKVGKLHKKNYKFHLIQDALGNYVISSITFPFMHKPRNIVEGIVLYIEEHVCHFVPFVFDDEYIWKPELRIVPYSHNVICVPTVNRSENTYINTLNYVFDFNKEDRYLKGKYLYLDTISEAFYDYTVSIIRDLRKVACAKDISIYVHPRTDEKSYVELDGSANIVKCPVPWELFYINRMTSNKVVLGIYTSAMAMGFIVCDDYSDVYSFVKRLDANRSPLCLSLFERIAQNNNHFHLISKIEEMNQQTDITSQNLV